MSSTSLCSYGTGLDGGLAAAPNASSPPGTAADSPTDSLTAVSSAVATAQSSTGSVAPTGVMGSTAPTQDSNPGNHCVVHQIHSVHGYDVSLETQRSENGLRKKNPLGKPIALSLCSHQSQAARLWLPAGLVAQPHSLHQTDKMGWDDGLLNFLPQLSDGSRSRGGRSAMAPWQCCSVCPGTEPTVHRLWSSCNN